MLLTRMILIQVEIQCIIQITMYRYITIIECNISYSENLSCSLITLLYNRFRYFEGCFFFAVVELLEDGVDPCCSDNKQRTPLHFASSQGYEKVGESQVQFNM